MGVLLLLPNFNLHKHKRQATSEELFFFLYPLESACMLLVRFSAATGHKKSKLQEGGGVLQMQIGTSGSESADMERYMGG